MIWTCLHTILGQAAGKGRFIWASFGAAAHAQGLFMSTALPKSIVVYLCFLSSPTKGIQRLRLTTATPMGRGGAWGWAGGGRQGGTVPYPHPFPLFVE